MDQIKKRTEELFEAKRRLIRARAAVETADAQLAAAREALDDYHAQRAELRDKIVDTASTFGTKDDDLVELAAALRNVLLRIPTARKLIDSKAEEQSAALHELGAADLNHAAAARNLEAACLKEYAPEPADV